MKPSLPAVLYGLGLLLAFGAGWFLKPPTSPDSSAAISAAAVPAVSSNRPHAQKPGNAFAASGENSLEATAADVAAVRAAIKPGVVNQVLLEKLKATLEVKDADTRNLIWHNLISEMRSEDALAIQEIFSGLKNDGRRATKEFQFFLRHWGRIDGITAANQFGGLPVQDDQLRAVMAGWGQQDAKAALDWLKGQDKQIISSNLVLSGLIEGSASIDLNATERLLLENTKDPAFQKILGRMAWIRVEQDGLTAALHWFHELSNQPVAGAYKTANLDSLVLLINRQHDQLGQQGPVILNKLGPYVGEPWLPDRAAHALGSAWAGTNPIAGIVEIQKMTSPEAKEAAVQSLSVTWAAKNPESLSAWLAENRAHPIFDQAAFQLVQNIQGTDPDAAQAWAAQIKDSALRSTAIDSKSTDPFAPVQ